MSEPVTGFNAWAALPTSDQSEFLKIVMNIKQKQNSKNVSIEIFRNQIQTFIDFIDINMETRAFKSMLIGIAFVGPYMCTNTKIFAPILGRSKSSINNSLKDTGYAAIKNERVRQRILDITLPNLTAHQSKQWSVRATTNNDICFKTKFTSPLMPKLNTAFFSADKNKNEPLELENGNSENTTNESTTDQLTSYSIIESLCDYDFYEEWN